MRTSIIFRHKYRPQCKGLYQTDYIKVISFWNHLFPITYLKPNLDISSDKYMIQLPMSKWKIITRKSLFRIFNLKIGRFEIHTELDKEILYYEKF